MGSWITLTFPAPMDVSLVNFFNENSEEHGQYTLFDHSMRFDTSSIEERTPGNAASSHRAESGWVGTCTINIYIFNRDMIYLSHSNNAILSLGIRSDLKYIHSISFNDVIGWFGIFSNIQVICFHPSYWFTKSNIFHYWEVIETLQKRGKTEHYSWSSVPWVLFNVHTSPTPTPEICSWPKPHLHKLLTESSTEWCSHKNIHFTVAQCPLLPAVSSFCLAGLFCVSKHKYWAPFNTAELIFLYRYFIDKELQFSQEILAFTPQKNCLIL